MSPPDPLPEIELTRVESDIVDTVRATLSHYKLGTTVRAAGGWVRDKASPLPSSIKKIVIIVE